jgi:hypothetical protein
VEVAGTDSSEVWAGFRVGRRARPRPPQVERSSGAISVRCSHDGYTHLPGRPLHTRTWRFDAGSLHVEDEVGNVALPAVARYHLAPGIKLEPSGTSSWRVDDVDGPLARIDVEHGQSTAEESFHAPRFGVVEPAGCLAVTLERGRATTRWSWLR